MSSVPERDWKRLRAMNDELLNLACERIFEKVQSLIAQRGEKSHEAYLRLWQLLGAEDDQISAMFDDLTRSRAIYNLAAWRRNGLLTDEELAQFSEQTRETIRLLNRE
jgi:hypothetical protein